MSESRLKYASKIYLKPILVLLIAAFLVACNTSKRATIKELKSDKSVEFLSQQLAEKSLQFDWISGKMAIDFKKGTKTESFKATFRLRKDSVIWMSVAALGIEVVRAVITPDSIKFIDKLHKQYFIGDFNYLSVLLKTHLNFTMLQAVLLGNEYWIAEREDLYAAIDADANAYLLSTVRKRKLRKIEKKDKDKVPIAQGIWVKPETFKILAILINDISNKRRLKITYSDFKEIDGQIIARKMNAIIESPEGSYSLGVKLSKLKIDKVYDLSFNIPENYVKIH